jgi:hypothetical protein
VDGVFPVYMYYGVPCCCGAGGAAECSIHCTMLANVWLGLLAIPFWAGASVAVGSRRYPAARVASQKMWLFLSSPPSSVLIVFLVAVGCPCWPKKVMIMSMGRL